MPDPTIAGLKGVFWNARTGQYYDLASSAWVATPPAAAPLADVSAAFAAPTGYLDPGPGRSALATDPDVRLLLSDAAGNPVAAEAASSPPDFTVLVPFGRFAGRPAPAPTPPPAG